MRRQKNNDAPTEPGSALDALLLAEREAAGRLEDASAAAAIVHADAVARVAELERESAAALSAELQAMDAEHHRMLAEIERDVEQSAADTVARYHAITPVVITRCARRLLADVTGLSLPDAP